MGSIKIIKQLTFYLVKSTKVQKSLANPGSQNKENLLLDSHIDIPISLHFTTIHITLGYSKVCCHKIDRLYNKRL